MNKKLLIVTYYWPPSGGSGVQRWLKFVKYLPQLGWEPFVYTPENPSFTIQDNSLDKDIPDSVEIIKLPIWEPYGAFFKLARLFGKKDIKQSDFITTGKKSLFQKLSAWIRGNFLIPDARIFWVKPSVAFLHDFMRSNEINQMITTGPPHSIHLIGLKLKQKNPSLKWIADFRDPWTEWDLLDTLSLTSIARKIHKKQERAVLQTADRVITIAPFHVTRLEALGDRSADLVTNGFDEDDFRNITRVKTSKFTIRHIGIVDELRDPRPVMEAIRMLCESNSDFASTIRIEFIGNVNSAFKEFVQKDTTLSKITQFLNQISHSVLLTLYGQTDLQLLVLASTAIAPGNLPGKFFEYLASGNPILAIGPVEGDAAAVLVTTKSGKIFERSDNKGIQRAILTYFNDWKEGRVQGDRDVSAYTREKLTQQLVHILETL
ncbi:MAG: glycosyltransferase family 4 protein [Bacteroidia bacterium]|nr:glycosyltransferase family 4 protein [Bacteroidia bacterium]